MSDRPFSEQEAANRLGFSKATLMRERIAGKIHPMRHGARVIRYTQAIIDEYQSQCRNVSDKSENTGSAKGEAVSNGAGRGTTPTLDKQDVHHLAQSIFKTRKSRSGNGSPSTAA